jgi:hypothetical protein
VGADCGGQALAWELKTVEGFELLYDGGPPDGERRTLFPLARPEVGEAFELAARVGERGRGAGIRGLTGAKFAAALRHLRLLDRDGRRVSRADADLLYVETMKEQDRCVPPPRLEADRHGASDRDSGS